jgi:uncharacterized phage-associated protein
MFEFRERKATEAAARLLELGGGRMAYMKLIKLLYMADRQSLVETGFSITGDRMFSMEHGPVLSRLLNWLKREAHPSAAWRGMVSPPVGYDVDLVQPLPAALATLSDYEIDLLATVWSNYGHMDQFQLEKYLHDTLPEWVNPGKSSDPIEVETILRAEGWTDDDIAAWSEELNAASSMSRLLSGSVA